MLTPRKRRRIAASAMTQKATGQEPSVEETISILSGLTNLYGQHHKIPITHEAVVSAVHLSKRFITDRHPA